MTAAPQRRAAAVLFDKDGTLFDFTRTWSAWALGVMDHLAQGDGLLVAAMARELRFDLDSRSFWKDSPVIAGTSREAAECLARGLGGRDAAALESFLSEAAARAPVVEAVPLAPLLDRLRGAGLRLGVMTNDNEAVAYAHLGQVGVADRFDFVAGFDSGHGAKPSPEPLLAFAAALDLSPAQVVMVGDSTHDLMAGRAAGMMTVGVLTGPAGAEELRPLADAVLPDIGHLPDWLRIVAT
ncbi:HAD family hydrolase [Salipiger mangrovisoli]|uniref:HAD family hydrolase n=1 Tax=Salipiger mangrovisoli TaxID=2865933 RepID=A0ABR9X8J7_9RHOB|nr:HAD family hydrolase [Salipiger mangrovisoli]MBE9639940.1 HAD family hydrolase [Salipiger mangrovisoli]